MEKVHVKEYRFAFFSVSHIGIYTILALTDTLQKPISTSHISISYISMIYPVPQQYKVTVIVSFLIQFYITTIMLNIEIFVRSCSPSAKEKKNQ